MSHNKTSKGVYTKYNLHISTDKFFIEPLDVVKSPLLVIDRVTAEIHEEANEGQIPSSASQRLIYGILGVIHLISGPHLIVVTDRSHIGLINNQDVYMLKGTSILSYARTNTHLSQNQIAIDKEYLSLLELILNSPGYYFSYTYDLSHSMQRLHNTPPDFLKKPLHIRGEQKFIWNEYLLNEFTKQVLVPEYCLPIIYGFVSINSCVLRGRSFTFTLISRRSKERAGRRLFIRGVDNKGHVANFVETEQIIETGTDRASFVQTRGSMPFFWQQWPNLRYKPRPTIIQNENHVEAFNKHFEEQVLEYGKQIIVNLVDQKGAEGKLEYFYRELVSKSGNPNLRYEAFDFHSECSKMRWDRLSILIDRLAHEQEEMGVMLTMGDGKVVSEQDGVFRTNCIDCLDRTNVVQSLLATVSLEFILKKVYLLPATGSIRDDAGLQQMLRHVWTDNGDRMSLQYAGTGALKTDFTRNGVRTHKGLLQDLRNSMLRYYFNNLFDGTNQDSIDLILGNYVITPGEGKSVRSPLDSDRGWKYTTFPLVLLVAVAMFFANLVAPPEYTTFNLACLMFWGAMMSLTTATIFYCSGEFIDCPRLVQHRLTAASSRP
uniref:Phosphatidylinositol-3-phosphatase SAC1 n=3 Tax=Rhodnius prolixus TaxID=13249 RepID=T1HA14_RHOPR